MHVDVRQPDGTLALLPDPLNILLPVAGERRRLWAFHIDGEVHVYDAKTRNHIASALALGVRNPTHLRQAATTLTNRIINASGGERAWLASLETRA